MQHLTDALQLAIADINAHADILALGNDTEQDAAVWLRLFVVACYSGKLRTFVPLAEDLEGAWLEGTVQGMGKLSTDSVDGSVDMSGAE